MFSKKHTDLAKGVACLLLLLHHLFYNSPATIAKFTPFLMVCGVPLACVLSGLGKVCVAMFLMLSGYGVAVLLNKHTCDNNLLNNGVRVSVRMILKLLFSFWFVFVLFVPWQGLMGHWTYKSWYHIIIDFFGVADIFGTSTINRTWWYVSMALICYALTPLMYILLKKFPAFSVSLTLCAFVILDGRVYNGMRFEYFFWLCNYFAGMLLYEYGVLNRITTFASNRVWYKWMVWIPLVLTAFWLRYNKGISVDPLFSFIIISFAAVCLYEIPLLSRGLQFVGKHSGNIFFMHTFIYLYDFENIIYFPRYTPLIYLLCLGICLFVSMFIEWLKNISKYNIVTKALIKKVS
ncbi:MAG: acyltransferase [Ruminococcaceae bacterium]|nr:acyltransferase [Oscillospiraceae bacterium]